MKNLLVITLLFSSFGFGSVFDQTLNVTTLKCPNINNRGETIFLRINENTKELKFNMLEKVKYTGMRNYSIEAEVFGKKISLLTDSMLLKVVTDDDKPKTSTYYCLVI